MTKDVQESSDVNINQSTVSFIVIFEILAQFDKQFNQIIEKMGCCVSGKPRKQKKQAITQKLQVNCPICEQIYDTQLRKPYFVCQNRHKLCRTCLTAIMSHSRIKRMGLPKCPFCKCDIEEDLISTNRPVLNFVDQEMEILKLLKQDQIQLYAFTAIYLPKLHEFMRKQATSKQGHKKNVQTIQSLRIKGKLFKQYQNFDMTMLNCLKNLHRIYLVKNNLKSIDFANFKLRTIEVLNLSQNNVSSLMPILKQANDTLAYLKLLNVRHNNIESIDGLNKFTFLQQIDASHNKISSRSSLKKAQSLRHINLQFNKITSIAQLDEIQSSVQSIQLFGNQIPISCYIQILSSSKLKNLTFLTATIQNALQEHMIQFSELISPQKYPNMKFVVIETTDPALQNTNQIVLHVSQTDQLINKSKNIIITKQSYELYMEHQSIVRQIIEKSKYYHVLGKNVNFFPTAYDLRLYQEDHMVGTFKRIKAPSHSGLLVAKPLPSDRSGSYYASFISNTDKIRLGVREMIEEGRNIEIDIAKRLFRNSQNHQVQEIANLSGQKGDLTLSIQLDLSNLQLAFYLSDKCIKKTSIEKQWESYRFYASIQEQGKQISVVKTFREN